jgi:hypothetical protein
MLNLFLHRDGLLSLPFLSRNEKRMLKLSMLQGVVRVFS